VSCIAEALVSHQCIAVAVVIAAAAAAATVPIAVLVAGYNSYGLRTAQDDEVALLEAYITSVPSRYLIALGHSNTLYHCCS
jgi:hypothetical protein